MNRWVAPLLLTAAHTARFTVPVVAVVSLAAHAQQGDIIRDIKVEGTQRIEVGTVISYLTVKPGDPFEPAQKDS